MDLERHLHGNGTRIVKFFLHLSKEEQRKRFLARIDEPEKNWKFSLADIEERKFWKHYMKAYEECLSATSTSDAPWYVVPADDKENARLIVSQIVLDTLEDLEMTYPKDERRTPQGIARDPQAAHRWTNQALMHGRKLYAGAIQGVGRKTSPITWFSFTPCECLVGSFRSFRGGFPTAILCLDHSHGHVRSSLAAGESVGIGAATEKRANTSGRRNFVDPAHAGPASLHRPAMRGAICPASCNRSYASLT